MNQPGSNALVPRMIGAAKLDVPVYEDIEHDTNATTSALLVVVIAAIASGIAGLGINGITGLISGIVGALISWVLYAAVAYYVGTTFLKGPETRATVGELLRTLGFAQAPQVLLVLAFIPIVNIVVVLVVAIWMLLTTVVAVRQALDMSTGRAIATAIIAAVIAGLIRAVLATII